MSGTYVNEPVISYLNRGEVRFESGYQLLDCGVWYREGIRMIGGEVGKEKRMKGMCNSVSM